MLDFDQKEAGKKLRKQGSRKGLLFVYKRFVSGEREIQEQVLQKNLQVDEDTSEFLKNKRIDEKCQEYYN